jgi:hypothetical protein
MPACSLCENVQPAGEACDLCGHPFPVGERTPVPVEPLEGLEATIQGPVQVTVEAMEDFMSTDAEGIPDDPMPGPEPVATCRYCQNPAPPGEAFCVHCGMRLPTAPGGWAGPRPEVRLCSDCSTPVTGSSCPGCGARVSR